MISCRDVQRKFRDKEVLKAINFQIEDPKIVALVGHNGAGKSTLMRLLAGRLKPNAGQILIENVAPFQHLGVAMNTVLIEEDMSFSDSLTLKEHFKWAKSFYPNWQQGIAESLCEYANLDMNAFYDNLSKGQAATFRLIYGLCSRSPYTYLDEPMNGMDEGIRNDFYRVILKEYIAAPRMMIISTHYLNEIRQLVEDVLIVHEGQIRMHATIDELDAYALYIQGASQEVEPVLEGAEVLFKGEDRGFMEAVVVAEQFDVQNAHLHGLQVRNLEAHVTSRYLTSYRQGGIDDVYK
jgi:ABC-2 type transport system ATP-binding protein